MEKKVRWKCEIQTGAVRGSGMERRGAAVAANCAVPESARDENDLARRMNDNNLFHIYVD